VSAEPVVETRLRVRYSETDRMGIVYHGNYIVWFEIGRTEYCRAAGMPYRRMEDAGVLILVTSVACTFRRSARYDDPMTVRTRMTELTARGCAFRYEILGTDGTLHAEGETRHVFADAAGRPRRAPEEFLRPLADFRGSSGIAVEAPGVDIPAQTRGGAR
jgi:acyl-CoA thioester hydrolase